MSYGAPVAEEFGMPKSPYTHGPSEVHKRPELRHLIQVERDRIGACLRAHRQERGLTREQAAVAIGIHPAHLAKIELGSANVTLSTLTAIAFAYGISLRALYFAPPAECECA
jgi:DNA-binding XRE family transcriptional regulator